MRARYPDTEGFVERDGVKVGYEVFGSGEPAARVRPDRPDRPLPGLEGPGAVPGPDVAGGHHRPARATAGRTGRSRPPAYADTEFVADTIAVMDAAGVDRAVLVGLCSSAWTSLLTAALHPDRVLGVVGDRHLGAVPYRRPAPCAPSTTSTRPATPTRAGPRRTGTTGCATGAASPSSSSASCCPSRTRPSSARTASAGRWTPAPRRSAARRRAALVLAAARRPRPCWPRVRCPVLAIHGRRRPLPAVRAQRAGRRADRRPTC